MISSLYQPGLNCANCFKVYSSNKRAPACFKNACDIQDILQAPEGTRIRNIVDAFITAEVLKDEAGYGNFIEQYLKKSGLNDLDPAVILRMKGIFREYQQKLRQKHAK